MSRQTMIANAPVNANTCRCGELVSRLFFILSVVCLLGATSAFARPSSYKGPPVYTPEEWNLAFPRGRAVLLEGGISESDRQVSRRKSQGFISKLKSLGFEVTGPESASAEHLLQTFRDPNVTLIVWAALANPEGLSRDANLVPIDENFLTLPGSRLKYFVASTSFGEAVVRKFGLKDYPEIQTWGAKYDILAIDVYAHASNELSLMMKTEGSQAVACEAALKSGVN